jgi:hypothetical protein
MMGCAVMLVAFLLLPALGVKLGGVLPYLLVLACPLSHLLMMGFMGKEHEHSGHGGGQRHEHDHAGHGPAIGSQLALPAPRDQD